MTPFVKKAFLLAFSLTCLIHFGDSYTLVPGIAVPANSPIPQRRELRTFILDATSLNIYLIALERMQQTSTDQLLSFYKISGIHGTNFAWDNDTGGNFEMGYGYCYHADRLFPTWHRPYLSLYEKTLLDLATQIVQGFPAGSQKNSHLSALTKWRMPYWDWAMDPSLPSILRNKNVAVTRMQNGALKKVTILNPLYSYRFQILNDPNTVIFSSPPQTIETVRNPAVQNNIYTSQQTLTNNQMIASGSDLKNAVYDALTAVTDYNSFANVADGPSSIEGVHGSVHVIVGGIDSNTGIGGHMTYIGYSSFDPIFYLHHTNIDRLFAMWQVLYPDSYLTDDITQSPNQDTELHPFRKTDSQYWTSRLARNLTVFGYTYPEVAGWSKQTVTTAVNKLYGPTSSTGRRRRKRESVPINNPTSDTSSIVSDIIQNISSSLNIPLPTNMQNWFLAASNEYRAQIQISSAAAKGSFMLCVFLGEPSSDQSNYTADPNFVGLFGVFAPENVPQSRAKLIQGTVSLTAALNKLIITKRLTDTTPDNIRSYLSQNIRVRIVGDQNKGFDTTGFQINVVTAALNLPTRPDIMPVWGKFSSIYQGTRANLANKINFLPGSNILSMIDQMTETDATN